MNATEAAIKVISPIVLLAGVFGLIACGVELYNHETSSGLIFKDTLLEMDVIPTVVPIALLTVAGGLSTVAAYSR
jgi:hypothetical protein